MQKRAKFVKKISLTFTTLVVGVGLFAAAGFVSPANVGAQTSPDEFNSTKDACPPGAYKKDDGSPCATSRSIQVTPPNKVSLVDQLVNPFITLMTAIVGVIIAISLVAAAITYSSAGGDPSKVAAAKKRITNTIVALIAYLFTFGLLQWLVPGGIV